MKGLMILAAIFISNLMLFNPVLAKNNDNILKSDQTQVNQWNNFVRELYQLHLALTENIDIETKAVNGGYGGSVANQNFYKEVSYFNRKSQQLISKIQWEVAHPDTIHAIEVNLYDKNGNIKTDFYARFLPYARNAPVQTLINLHNYTDQLHAFRQFDASGELIYETCRGKFFNEVISLHLDDHEIIDFRTSNDDEVLNEAYASCFFNVSQSATNYLHPNRFITSANKASETELNIDYHLSSLNQKIQHTPSNALLYIQRGELYFKLHNFDKSVSDFNMAISIDNTLDQAYFGRGMSLARNGKIEEGIQDLTHYINKNPLSSLAYTKRGVRYIWAGQLNKAQKDLLKAIELDSTNAEAHDDLGVIYAQQKDFINALKHFKFAVQHDPNYQKAYHNQAMAFSLTNAYHQALIAVNKSLALDSQSRNSLMLKGEILMALGKEKEAEATIRKAEFLPEGNWSEHFTLQ